MAAASALDPYLERLAALERHGEEPERSSVIHVGEETISIDPWERAHILASLDGAGDWSPLLARGAALRTKSLVDLSQGTGGAALAENVDLGDKLLGELQAVIDRLVQTGDMDEARRVTRYRHQVARLLDRVRQSIEQVENTATRPNEAAAQAMRDAATDPARKRPHAVMETSVPDDVSVEEVSDDAVPASKPAPRGNRLRLLLLILLLMAVAWAGLWVVRNI